MTFLLGTVLLAAIGAGAAGPVAAQDLVSGYPAKPVTIIVPAASGGPTDAEGRIYANKLSENLGKPFVLDFKPGSGNRAGTDALVKAAPDGHTLMYSGPTYSVVPLMRTDLSYDVFKAVAPVSLISKRYALIVVNPSLPIQNMKEYVAYAKANPGKLNVGAAGVGGAQHLTAVWLNSLTGTDTTLVFYKGTAPMYVDILAGRTHLTFTTLVTAIPHLKSGKVRAIAQANLVRHPDMPQLPTVTEAGYPGFEYSSWLGVFAPGPTPAPLREKIALEFKKTVTSPEVIKRVGNSLQLLATSPAELEQYYLQEFERWKKLAKDNNIKFED